MARRAAVLAAVLAVVLLATAAAASAKAPKGRWLAGDMQTHTNLTDGNQSQVEVDHQAFGVYGLDYLANSEPGGSFRRRPGRRAVRAPVWRWITLANYSFPIDRSEREDLPGAYGHPGPRVERPQPRAGERRHRRRRQRAVRHQQLRVPLRRQGHRHQPRQRGHQGRHPYRHVHVAHRRRAHRRAPRSGTTVTITTISTPALLARRRQRRHRRRRRVAGYNGTFTVVSVPSEHDVHLHGRRSGLARLGRRHRAAQGPVTDVPAVPFSKLNAATRSRATRTTRSPASSSSRTTTARRPTRSSPIPR